MNNSTSSLQTESSLIETFTETGLNSAIASHQQLAEDYLQKKAAATKAIADLKEAKERLETARTNGDLDAVWNIRSKAFLMPCGLKIRETSRTTYSRKSYSDTLQKLMDTEQEDGTAKPTVSTFFDYKIVED